MSSRRRVNAYALCTLPPLAYYKSAFFYREFDCDLPFLVETSLTIDREVMLPIHSFTRLWITKREFIAE